MTNTVGGAYGALVNALNRLEEVDEMPLADDGFLIVGMSASVVRDPDSGKWTVVQA